MWIKNTSGKPDAMLTFATFSFAVVTLNVFLATFDTLTFNNFSVSFKSLDTSIMALYLGSTFTAYVSRRWTETKYGKVEMPSTPAGIVAGLVGQVLNSTITSQTQADLPAQPSLDSSSQENLQTPTDVANSSVASSGSLDTTATIKRRKPRRENP